MKLNNVEPGEMEDRDVEDDVLPCGMEMESGNDNLIPLDRHWKRTRCTDSDRRVRTTHSENW
jgi:hypothetical protein